MTDGADRHGRLRALLRVSGSLVLAAVFLVGRGALGDDPNAKPPSTAQEIERLRLRLEIERLENQRKHLELELKRLDDRKRIAERERHVDEARKALAKEMDLRSGERFDPRRFELPRAIPMKTRGEITSIPVFSLAAIDLGNYDDIKMGRPLPVFRSGPADREQIGDFFPLAAKADFAVGIFQPKKPNTTLAVRGEVENFPPPRPKTPLLQGKGTVTAVDVNVGAVSLGSDDGIERDMVLQVYRLSPQPTYLGTLTIKFVRPRKAIGVFEPASPGKTIAVGDTVDTKSIR